MPTYLTLANEGPWWNAEKMSLTMTTLAVKLRAFYRVGPDAIGAKGDNAPGHMRGAHRSRAWILNSIYCTDRSYTVSETEGNRTGGDDDWLAGMDITIPAEQLIPMCQRLDAAVRAGQLEKITEWYGNDDGDNRVDGYDNIRNVVATSDDSHLWHAHLTFDRGRAGEDHSDVYAILTGEDDVSAEEVWAHPLAQNIDGVQKVYPAGDWLKGANVAAWEARNILADTVVPALARVEALLADVGGNMNAAAIIAAVRGEADAVKAEVRDAVADLGEGGAAAVRNDPDA